jgi:PIN domain nuclease of toxin-antitoxin system
VTGNLLDTNIALIALAQPHRLSSALRRAVATGPNFLSVVSYWEVLLKSMKGNLDVGDPRLWWRDALDQLEAQPILLRPDHLEALYELPRAHKDPFDRMLIAQAISEDLRLATTDETVRRYAAGGLRFVPLK